MLIQKTCLSLQSKVFFPRHDHVGILLDLESLVQEFFTSTSVSRGRDSSVGTVTCYGLDGPGVESRWGRDFPHPSRQALGPNQPPVQWVSVLSWGQSGRSMVLTPQPHLQCRGLKVGRALSTLRALEVFLPYFCFSLPVSLHQCSILIRFSLSLYNLSNRQCR